MENNSVRKLVREILNEYGNFAFLPRANAYSEEGSVFPQYDEENPKTPAEIDFWDDLEFKTDEDIPISEDEDIVEEEY